jgi:hypothetical protein
MTETYTKKQVAEILVSNNNKVLKLIGDNEVKDD